MLVDEAVCIGLPAVVKAFTEEGGRRIVECQASAQVLDSEGDVILQAALLGSAEHFVKSGVIDIDHIAFIGSRLNPPIPDPSSFIIGKPLAVSDMGGGNTAVRMELNQGPRATEVWKSLQADPPMPWRASIYGFPTSAGWLDVRKAAAGIETYGATRYLVSRLTWDGLALTMNPVCAGIETTAHIIKSMLGKSLSVPIEPAIPTTTAVTLANMVLPPRSREELMGQFLAHISEGRCPHAGGSAGNSVFSFREHFAECCLMDPYQADIAALALMQLLKRRSRT